MRFFILIVASATFCHSLVASVAKSQTTNDGVMLRERVQKWSDWSKNVVGDYTVAVDTGEVHNGKPIINIRTIQRKANGYRCIRLKYSDGNGLANVAIIQNPAYSGKLQMGLNDEWVLTGLILRSDPDYEKRFKELSIVGADYFHTKIVNSGLKIIPLALEPAGYSLVAVEEKGEATAYTLEFKKGHHTDPPKYSMIRLHFAKSGLAPPVQIDFTFPDRKLSRVSRDWTKVGGKEVPTKNLFYSPEFVSPGMTPSDTETFDYSNFEAPFDTATCYLSHYGLPEPSGVSPSGRTWWILTGVGVILVILGFVMRQRWSAAN